jgi:myo-inositol 2-dehydrogenase / D-chiro-inositol 1-dehydrogenase
MGLADYTRSRMRERQVEKPSRMTRRTVSFCLLGAGRIGRIHAANILRHPLAVLSYVADPAVDARERLAAETGARPLADPMAALTDPDVEAVLIASPTDTHVDLALAAAAAGKAIFCEKPLDLSLARANAAAAIITAHGVAFLTGFNRRFDPNVAEVKRRILAGDIGDVEVVGITSRDPSPPPIDYVRSSGGLFRDMTIHDLDMARFLLGEEPVEVTAAASCLVAPAIGAAGDVDTAAVTLKTASGKLCQISNSRRAVYGYDQRVEVFGSGGMVQAQNPPRNALCHSGTAGIASATLHEFFLDRYATAYTRELDHFIDGLLHDRPISPTLVDGQRALLLAECCETSFREGRTISVAPHAL